jgi:hypothetical protein
VGERRLSEAQIGILGAWAEAGAPRGDAGELPPAPKFAAGWSLGEPDMVVKMSEAFTVPASGRDIYRAFVVPLNNAEDRYVVGVEFRPGNPKILHHCILYLDTSGKARELDAKDPELGYRSFGGPGFLPAGGLGGWAPGATAYWLKNDTGRLVRANSDVVIQVHYHPSGKVETDQSSLALYFAKKPPSRMITMIPLVTRDIDIAAGEKHYTRNVTTTVPIDVTLTGVIPHMHLLGREMKVTATTPSGEVVPLIWINDWDFRWQDQYQFANEIHLPAGTKLDMSAVYDNSADNAANPNSPPKRVTHGEQTTDEMCLCFLQMATGNLEDVRTIRRSMMLQRLLENPSIRGQKK